MFAGNGTGAPRPIRVARFFCPRRPPAAPRKTAETHTHTTRAARTETRLNTSFGLLTDLERPPRLLDHVDRVQVALPLQPQHGADRQRRKVLLVAAEDLRRQRRLGHVGAVRLVLIVVCLHWLVVVVVCLHWFWWVCWWFFGEGWFFSVGAGGGNDDETPPENNKQPHTQNSQVPLERLLVARVVERAARQRGLGRLRRLAEARDHRRRVDLSPFFGFGGGFFSGGGGFVFCCCGF